MTAHQKLPPAHAVEDTGIIKLPYWLRNVGSSSESSTSTSKDLSITIHVTNVPVQYVTNSTNPVIPNLSALTEGPPGAGSGSGGAAGIAGPGASAGGGAGGAGGSARVAVTPVVVTKAAGRDAHAQFRDAVDSSRRSDATFAGRLAVASDEWKRMEVGYLGAVADELQQVFTSALFPSNRFTRRRPDYSGPSLSTRGLIRYVITHAHERSPTGSHYCLSVSLIARNWAVESMLKLRLQGV